MSERLFIRDASVDDAPVIAEIYNESILVQDATMIDQPIKAEEIRRHIEIFSEREGYVLLERGNFVVGWGVIKEYGEGPAYRYAGETSVFLRRSEVRKGYGTYLKRYLLVRCKVHGYHHLVARIWASNEASIAYNRKFGYEVVGIQREIGHMDGLWRDIAIMQLILT